MKCEKIRGEFMEAVLSGPAAVTPRLEEHLQACDSCAQEWISLQQTMSLMDEWTAPEPSPYFTSRLHARVREEATSQTSSWMAWFRKPVLAAAAAALVGIGVGMLESGHWSSHNTLAHNDDSVVRVAPGTPVGDLQYLDKNADLFSEFDALDGQSATE